MHFSGQVMVNANTHTHATNDAHWIVYHAKCNSAVRISHISHKFCENDVKLGSSCMEDAKICGRVLLHGGLINRRLPLLKSASLECRASCSCSSRDSIFCTHRRIAISCRRHACSHRPLSCRQETRQTRP